MKKQLLFTVCAALAALSANAATIVDTWSTAGGAWKPANQPQFAQTGIANPDKGSQGGGKLVNPEKFGLFEAQFYTLFTAPTLTVAVDKPAANLKAITLEVIISGKPEEGPTLNFNSEHPAVAPSKVTEGAKTDIRGIEAITRTYIWDVADFGTSEAFSIKFSLGNHTAFTKLQLTQTTAE